MRKLRKGNRLRMRNRESQIFRRMRRKMSSRMMMGRRMKRYRYR